jgi:hypothetical protein
MEGAELDALEEARTIAAALRASLPKEVDAIEQGITHKTLFYLIVARESLLHRVSGLAEDTFSLIDAGRNLGAAILTRSMLETTAVLGFLLRSVEVFERTNDVSVLYGRVAKVVVGSRNGDEGDPVSVHVLDAIRDSDARLPVSGLTHLYENLSEFVHPNWSGLLGTFGAHENALLVRLGGQPRAVPALGPCLAIILSSFDHLYGVLGEQIETVAAKLQ